MLIKNDLKYITIQYLKDNNQLSVRAANCCTANTFYTLYDLVKYFNEKGHFFKGKIRNAGVKTVEELNNLCLPIILQNEKEEIPKTDIDLLKFLSDKTLVERELLKSTAELILKVSQISSIDIVKYGQNCKNLFVIEFVERYWHLPMLWILEQEIKNSENTEIKIFKDSFNIFQNINSYKLEELSQVHNLSKERIRQIRKKIYDELFKSSDDAFEVKKDKNIVKKLFLQNENKDWEYLLDFFENLDFINPLSIEIQTCKNIENCSFSNEFILQIIATIFSDTFVLFGGLDTKNGNNSFKSHFLIRRLYAEIFDFGKMKIEFGDILLENEKEYLLDIEEFIVNSQNWTKFDFESILEITSITREILLQEFGLYSEDINGKIRIPINKERKVLDIVYEILKQNGSPMHLEDIFVEFKKIMPEHKFSVSTQLRPYLQRHEAISFRNRKSVYTLKEWEHIKTGTIRDAIVEFLLGKELPQTAIDITEYVLQFFPETNVASIRTTMFNDTQKRFSFFNDNLFGLKVKEYPIEYELSEQQEVLRKSFEQRILDLELFVAEEGHFPFVSSEKSKESSLGRWWYRIINNKQQISEKQQTEVSRIKDQYAEYDTDKTAYEWNLNYNKLKCFLLENRRIPSAHGDEKFLYGWLRRVKEDFEDYHLTEEQRQKYIDLAKLI